MSLRRNKTTNEVRDISDEWLAALVADGNRKADHYLNDWEPFTPPEPEPDPVPESVTKRQLLHWLEFDHGVTDPPPEVAIPAALDVVFPPLTHLNQNRFAHREWDRCGSIRRDHAFVPLLAQVFQIADVDAAFREMVEKYG